MIFVIFFEKPNVRKRPSTKPGTDLKYQWFLRDSRTFDTYMMLNTDIELAYDIDVDNTGNGTQCIIGNSEDKLLREKRKESICRKSNTHSYVALYAKVRDVFLYEYPFQKYLFHVYNFNSKISNSCFLLFQDENAFLKDFREAYDLMVTAKITEQLTIPQ